MQLFKVFEKLPLENFLRMDCNNDQFISTELVAKSVIVDPCRVLFVHEAFSRDINGELWDL